MTITNEILAALVAVNLFVMGINVKFLFALWNDLKAHKTETSKDLKEIREHQSIANVGFVVGCRAAQKDCADSIRSYIREESHLAKNEARDIAELLREVTSKTAAELKEAGEERYQEFKRHGIELRKQLYGHTHDDHGKAVIK